MESLRPLTVGFVVSEHPHSPMHAGTLRLLDEVQAVYPCTLVGEDVGKLTAALGPKARPAVSLGDLLGRADVDVLLVALQNHLCPDVLRQAVAAGKPAIFEKPGSPTAQALRDVADLARQRGITLGAVLPWRYHPISREVRRLVQEGAFGRIMALQARVVTSQVRYRDPKHWLFGRKTAGSGILSWLGIHRLDLLTYLTGQRVRRVAALAATLNNPDIEVEDTASLALEYEGGALGTFLAGYLLPGARPGYEGTSSDPYLALHGYDGWMTWADSPRYTFFSTAAPWAVSEPEIRTRELPASAAYGGVHGLEYMRDSLRACLTGTPAPCPIEDAVYVLEVIEAALRASDTGAAQEVRP